MDHDGGVPLHVITDRGKKFESKLFAKITKIIVFSGYVQQRITPME